MTHPKFTFCIPNLNKSKYLPACIDSILSQSENEWECVFVDGFSSDGSWEYMQQFARDPRFKILRGLRQGMYADWNECLNHVQTEYFYFLPSDDICYPDLVSKTTAALNSHSDVDACHFQFAYIDEQENVTQTYDQIIQSQISLYSSVSEYAHRRSAHCEFMMHFVYRTIYRTMNSLVFRRSLIEKMGGFSSCYGPAGDYDWTMRLGFYTDVLYIPNLLAAWRRYDEQATVPSGLPQSHMNILKIAKSNLYEFTQLEPIKSYYGNLSVQHPLSLLEYRYGYALYKNIYNSSSLDELIVNIKSYFYNSKFHAHYANLLLRVFAFISGYRLFPYVSSKGFAEKLIRDYELVWPPVSLDEQ